MVGDAVAFYSRLTLQQIGQDNVLVRHFVKRSLEVSHFVKRSLEVSKWRQKRDLRCVLYHNTVRFWMQSTCQVLDADICNSRSIIV